MRRTPRVLFAVLVLGLIMNGPAAAFAAAFSAQSHSMQELPAQTGTHAAPCHEQSDPRPSSPEGSKPDCCEHAGCLCILGASGVAAVDAAAVRQYSPQHFSSVSALTAGHPHVGPALLLRPPIA